MALTTGVRRSLLLAQGARSLCSEDGGKKFSGLDSLFKKAKTGETGSEAASPPSPGDASAASHASTNGSPAATESEAADWSPASPLRTRDFLSSAGSSELFQDVMQNESAPAVSDNANPWFSDIVGQQQASGVSPGAASTVSEQGPAVATTASEQPAITQPPIQQEEVQLHQEGQWSAAHQGGDGKEEWQWQQPASWQEQQQTPVKSDADASWKLPNAEQSWQGQQQPSQQLQQPIDNLWMQPSQDQPLSQWGQVQQPRQDQPLGQWGQVVEADQQQHWQVPGQPQQQQQQEEERKKNEELKAEKKKDDEAAPAYKTEIPVGRVFKQRTPSLWDRVTGTPAVPVDVWQELHRHAEETPPLDDVSPIVRDADDVAHYVPLCSFSHRAEHASGLRQRLFRHVDRLQYLYQQQPLTVISGLEFRRVRSELKPLRRAMRRALGCRNSWYGQCVPASALAGAKWRGNRFPVHARPAASRRPVETVAISEDRLLTPEELDAAGAEMRSRQSALLGENFRTDEVKPSQHRSEHAGLFYNVDQKISSKLFSGGLPARLQEQVKDLRSFDILIREPALEIADAIRHIDHTDGHQELGVNPKLIISGSKGVGKSVLLLHCIQMCHDLGWLIFRMPDVEQTTMKKGRYYNPSIRANFYRQGRFDMPEHAADWLTDFVKISGDKLEDLKLTRGYDLSERDHASEGMPALKLVETGLLKSALASDVMGILLKEIALSRKYKCLVAMDSYNMLFQGCYRHPTGQQQIRPGQISHLRHFMRLLRDENIMSNGLAILALSRPDDRIDSLPSPHGGGHADTYLNEVGQEFSRPYYDVHVEPYNDKEFASTLQYYHSRKWIARDISLKFYQQFKFLSGSRGCTVQAMARSA